MASISSEGGKIAVTKDTALTLDQARVLLNGPKTSNIDALWENKYAVTYFFSKVLSLNGFIPFFFDYSAAKAADNKTAAQVKVFTDARDNLIKAIDARVNQAPPSEVARNDAKHRAETTTLKEAEAKALKKFTKTTVSIFASNVDLSKASNETVGKTMRVFFSAVSESANANRGSLSKAQLEAKLNAGTRITNVQTAIINFLAKTTPDLSEMDATQKAAFMKNAAKLTGMLETTVFRAVLNRQAAKSLDLAVKIDDKAEKLGKAVADNAGFSKEEISALKKERAEKRTKLEKKVKDLKADLKKANRALTRATDKFEKAENSFVSTAKRQGAPEDFSAAAFRVLCQGREYDITRCGDFLNRHTAPKFEAVVEAHKAVTKAERKVQELTEKHGTESAELRDVVALIRESRSNNANVIRDLRAKRQADLAALAAVTRRSEG